MTNKMAESPRPALDSSLAAKVKQALARFDGIELAIVLGSAAKRQLRFESDLDIAVKLGHALGVKENIAVPSTRQGCSV